MGVEIYGSGNLWESAAEPAEKLPKCRLGWDGNLWEWNLWEWNLWESAAEPAEKLPKCRLGWTRRAGTKTTNIPDLLRWLLPASGPEAP